MVEIKPFNSNQIQISTGDQQMVADNEDGEQWMRALAQQAQGQVRVSLRANGFGLDRDLVSVALELAGLNSFAAAKQTAKGYIEF